MKRTTAGVSRYRSRRRAVLHRGGGGDRRSGAALGCGLRRKTLAAIGSLLLLALSAPATAQQAVCCNLMVDMQGGWTGMARNCPMEQANAAQRAKVCAQLAKANRICEQVEAYCPKCDPNLYQDYLRKREEAMELFKHASDLRLQALYLIEERMGAEARTLRIEGEKEVAGDLAWDEFGKHVQRGMRDSRGALNEAWLARKIAQNAPFAAKAWNAIGWLDLLVQAAARGWLTAGEYRRYQDEAQEATRAAEELWRKALADFEAYLEQQPACDAEARRAAEEEKQLERAKQVIEEWENNQILYRDPITQEALTYQAAVKRAKQLLGSGQISSTDWQFIRVANALSGAPPSQQSLEAAIKELDAAMASFARMDRQISAYLSAQRTIEAKLQSAFATQSPAK